MNDILEKFSDPIFIVDIVLSVIILSGILFVIFKSLKRKFVIYFYLVTVSLSLISYIVSLKLLFSLFLVVLTIGTILFLFVNMGDVRQYIANPLKRNVKSVHKGNFDRETFYNIINDTVQILSKSKTGAIITFEKKNALNEFVKTGTKIDAPVTQELLTTIFYPGTRLHDGAVIIKDNIIIAASVYYPPTTRALTGKYGARHRAAFGISEVSDAITVVVSEETGRISLAYNSMLESVTFDGFYQSFVDLMSE